MQNNAEDYPKKEQEKPWKMKKKIYAARARQRDLEETLKQEKNKNKQIITTIIINMLNENLSLQVIAKVVGVSVKQVEQLVNNEEVGWL